MDNDSLCKRDRLKNFIPIVFKITADREDLINITNVDLRASWTKAYTTDFWSRIARYKLGWFRLANGAKAFLAISSDKTVIIKLKDNTLVILTPKNIDKFINKL